MKKFFKIILYITLGLLTVFLILLGTYVVVNQQGIIDPFQVGNPGAENKILIASQGSEFKERLLKDLLEKLESEDKYLYVVDCTALEVENVADWHAVIIIHSAQIHKMPEEAELFLKRATDLSKVMLISTSGAGDDMVEGFDVDAITTASRSENRHSLISWLLPRIENRLQNKN